MVEGNTITPDLTYVGEQTYLDIEWGGADTQQAWNYKARYDFKPLFTTFPTQS